MLQRRLIFTGGVSATSLDAVLAASGTSKSQLYHYFSDKDDLVLAVIAHQTEAVMAAQGARLDDVDSIAGLRRWRDVVVELQRRRGCVGGCPIGSLASELAESERPRDLLRGIVHPLGIDVRQRADCDARPGRPALRRSTGRPGHGADGRPLQGGLLLAQTTRSTRPLELSLDLAIDHIADVGRVGVATRRRRPPRP